MPDGHSPLFTSLRYPPANIMAEKGLLGALIRSTRAIEKCEALEPHHFTGEQHGDVFGAIRDAAANGRTLDGVALTNRFPAQLIGDLLSSAIGPVAEYAAVIRDCWVRREGIRICSDAVSEFYGPAGELGADQDVTQVASDLMALGEEAAPDEGVEFSTAAPAAVRRAEAAYKGDAGHARLDTGIAPIDALWNGLWPGQLYYLMARSRTGKTPAMLQIARHVGGRLLQEAERTGQPPGYVHIFSLEMTADDLLTVNLASTTRWTADQIRAGQIGRDHDWMELSAAADRLGTLPIHVDDRAEMDLSALALRARQIKRQKRTRLICIDYRELIRRPREHARMGLPEWIPFLGYQLKALAKSANVPVIALAQINKSRDNAESTRPTLNDLPYDGGQAADSVFALHRPELYMSDDAPKQALKLTGERQAAASAAWHAEREAARGIAEFHALKRRFGPPGFCKLRFDGPRMMLREMPPGDVSADLLNAPFPESEADYGD